MSKNEYKYVAQDESLLSPYINKYIIEPILKVFPKSIPANMITIFCNLFIVLTFIIAYFGYKNNNFNFYYLTPLLIFGYLVGDYLDGKQARRTNTSSALGEYFDHFLDTLVTGLLIGTLLLSYRIDSSFVISVALFSIYVGQSASFFEKYKTNVMHFDKIGSTEGVVILLFFIFISQFNFMQNLSDSAVVLGLPLFSWFILFTTAGPLFASINIYNRVLAATKDTHLLHIFYLLASLFFTILIAINYTLVQVILLSILFNAYYVSTLLMAMGLDTDEQTFDYFSLLAAFILSVNSYNTTLSFLILFSYLFIRLFYNFYIYFMQFKSFWYWKNPVQN